MKKYLIDLNVFKQNKQMSNNKAEWIMRIYTEELTNLLGKTGNDVFLLHLNIMQYLYVKRTYLIAKNRYTQKTSEVWITIYLTNLFQTYGIYDDKSLQNMALTLTMINIVEGQTDMWVVLGLKQNFQKTVKDASLTETN